MSFQFTRITSIEPPILSKSYTLEDGQLTKAVSAQLTRGIATRRRIERFSAFVSELKTLQTSEALTFGIASHDVAQIITKRAYEKLPESQKDLFLTRSNAHFVWPEGPAIMMFDIDPPSHGAALSRESVLKLFEEVCPMLREVPKIWFPSSSSHICCRETGEDLTGLRGQRLYMPVARGTEIPEIAEAIWTRLWAEGHGFIQISKSGMRRKSTPIDRTVYQPSRLDFAAGAATGPGLFQKRGKPEYLA